MFSFYNLSEWKALKNIKTNMYYFALHFARNLLNLLESEVKIIHIIVQDQDGKNNNIKTKI